MNLKANHSGSVPQLETGAAAMWTRFPQQPSSRKNLEKIYE